MKKLIKILLLCIPFILQGQTDTTQTDTIQNPDEYITPIFDVGCSSCYSPINLENHCHQIMKNTLRIYDLRGREIKEENMILGNIYIKVGIMLDYNRKQYPFRVKTIKLNQY
tara:strand:- start:2664 stop:2999 length:336 start_codon:yes stop_codon:yes gene_type:complete